MEDSQREAMYNGWANSKIWLDVLKEVDYEKTTVSVIFGEKEYKETVYKKDCFGNSNPYNIAFNRLLTKMKNIDKNIEMKYEWRLE